MQLHLWINHNPEEGWVLATEENCTIDPSFFTVNCHSAEDWGCPHGGLIPVNEEGEVVESSYFSLGDDAVYHDYL